MISKLSTRGLLFLLLSSLITFLLNSCQKEEMFGLEPKLKTQVSLLGESRMFFEQNILKQDKGLQARPKALRHRVAKMPLWDQAEKVQFSIGEGLKVPLAYGEEANLLISPNKTAVSLAELSYLLLYKDRYQQWKAEVVTQVPDESYWAHRHELNRAFSGIIIVEDWWGRPIKTFRKLPDQHIIPLGNPRLIPHKNKIGIQNLHSREDNCDLVISTNNRGMYEVDFICDLPGSGSSEDNSGGGGFGGFEWGNSGGGFDNGGFGGGGGPNHGDYDQRPNRGGGRRNDNPPPPPERPEINTPEEFLAEIDESELSPCFRAVLADVKTLSNGSVAGIIQKFAGEFPGFNWKLKVGSLPPNTNAITNTRYNRITGEVTTTFDNRKFNNASNISVARTIIHESIHAYLIAHFETNGRAENGGQFAKDYESLYEQYLKDNGANNANQHKGMSEAFINEIALALKQFSIQKGYNLPEQYFYDMAWGGLDKTEAFTALQQSDRIRILNLNSSEMTGYDLDNNFVGLKGSNLCNAIE